MPVRDPAGAAVLERRYLRLLRCYPPGHREVHREEMLGVLLAAARPGQRAPGLRQTVNLAACGLAIRVRRIPGWLAADAGKDALAVVSLIAPAVVVILLALAPGAMDATSAARVPFWTLLPFPPSIPGDDRLAGCGAAGADRRPGSSRGDRVHLGDDRLAGLAGLERTAGPVASRARARRACAVPGPGRRPYRPGQPGGLLAGLLPRPAARPGDRGVVASLPHDRGPVRRLRVPLHRSAGAPCRARAHGRSCLPPAGHPGDRARDSRHARMQPRGPAGRGAGSGRARAQSRRAPGDIAPPGPGPCSSSCSSPCWCCRWRSYPGSGGSGRQRARGNVRTVLAPQAHAQGCLCRLESNMHARRRGRPTPSYCQGGRADGADPGDPGNAEALGLHHPPGSKPLTPHRSQLESRNRSLPGLLPSAVTAQVSPSRKLVPELRVAPQEPGRYPGRSAP